MGGRRDYAQRGLNHGRRDGTMRRGVSPMGEGRALCADGSQPWEEGELFAQRFLSQPWEKEDLFAQRFLPKTDTHREACCSVHTVTYTQEGI